MRVDWLALCLVAAPLAARAADVPAPRLELVPAARSIPVGDVLLQFDGTGSGPSSSMLGALMIMGGGAAVTLLGTIIYFGASSDASDLDARYPVPGTPLPPADFDLAQSAITRGRVGSALVLAGVLAIAAGGAVILVPPAQGGPSMAVRWSW